MTKFFLTTLAVLVFAASVSAQNSAYDSEKNVRGVVFHSGNPCATEDSLQIKTVTGRVVLRQFEDDEITLQSFVIADNKDRRFKVTVEPLFLEQNRVLADSLSDLVALSAWVKVSYVACKSYLYLNTVSAQRSLSRRSR